MEIGNLRIWKFDALLKSSVRWNVTQSKIHNSQILRF